MDILSVKFLSSSELSTIKKLVRRNFRVDSFITNKNNYSDDKIFDR